MWKTSARSSSTVQYLVYGEGPDDDVGVLATAKVTDADGPVTNLTIQFFGPESGIRLQTKKDKIF